MAVSTIDALYNGTSEKLTTSATGITVTGNATFADNGKAIFGAGSDLQIYHSGSHSVIKDAGDGNLQLIANDFQLRNGADNANMMTGANGGAVTLMHNGSSKLATTSTGIDVTGKATLTSGELTFSGSISDPNGAAYIWRPADNTLAFGTANEERMRINSSGNVLIGTTTDNGFNFKVSDNGGYEFAFAPNDGSSGVNNLVNYNRSGSAYVPFMLSGLDLRFGSNGNTERMRIDSSGNVRLANTNMNIDNSGNTATGLSVASTGITHIATSGNNTSLLIQRVSDTGTDNAIYFLYGSTGVGSVTVNSSSTAYNTSSDYRLKENVVDLTGASARVNQLDVKRFNFIADDTNTLVDGFLAHEVATVVPEAITGAHNQVKVWKDDEELPDGISAGDNKLDDDGNTIPVYQGIDQSKLVPLLTAALQEALTEIASLKTRVEALEA